MLGFLWLCGVVIAPHSPFCPMKELGFYAGRWIAVDEGDQIVAVALRAEEALHYGQARYPKERLRLYHVTAHPPYLAWPAHPLRSIFAVADPQPLWIVGGALRDLLMDIPPHDWDFAVIQGAIPLARRVADHLGGAFYPLDRERDTARVILPGLSLDFAALRGRSLEEDLRLRDFTINAMALPPDGPPIDPTGGLVDLEARLLRQTSPRAFADDPLRLLRAVRLATRFGLHIEGETWHHLRLHASSLHRVAVERIREELWQIVALPQASTALRRMKMGGLLGEALPPLAALPGAAWQGTLRHLDAVTALITALEGDEKAIRPALLRPYRTALQDELAVEVGHGMPRRLLLKWGALLVAVPMPRVAALLADLRFPRRTQHFLLALLAGYARLGNFPARPDRRALYRFYHEVGEAAVAALLLAVAERLIPAAASLLEAAFHRHDEIIAPPRLLSGDDLLALGIPQGPQVGALLAALEEAQAAGELKTREEAIAFIRRQLP